MVSDHLGSCAAQAGCCASTHPSEAARQRLDSQVGQLLEMGFSAAAAGEALRVAWQQGCRGNAEQLQRALELLAP
jgi:hypothetical protein